MTYTHGHADSVLASHRTRRVADSAAYLAPHLARDQRLLDVGSGPGTLTADLATRVGTVVALEATEEAVELTAAELAQQQTVNATVELGDVHALEHADDSFDVVHAHQVLQHVADPVQALREMVRVCRPGGLVAVRDSDYSAFAWWPRLPELDRWLSLYLAAARANGGEPDAGRRLLGWAHAAGATDVTTSTSNWLHADPEGRSRWGGMWADRILTSRLTDQLLGSGMATRDELEQISRAWLRWAGDPDATFVVPHVELLIRVGAA